MEWPRPAEGTHLFILGDEAVLYSDRAQTIYLFNAAAGLIWSSLELGIDRATTAADLAHALRATPDEALRHIEACLGEWAALGILRGFEQPAPKPSPPPDTSGRFAHYPPFSERSWASERRYRLLDAVVRVRYELPELDTWAHPVLAHLENSSASAAVTVSVSQVGDRYYVHVDGRPAGRCSRLDRVAPNVKAAVWQAAVVKHRHLMQVHAGVVSDGASLILLPAPSGRGKSTLTAGLINAGFQYFSDETALLEEGSFRTAPVPMSLGVKSAAWELLKPLYPELMALPVHERPDRKLVRYMPPPKGSLPDDLVASLPVRRIIFPHYDPTAPTDLRPLSKGETLTRLLDQCLAVPVELNPERVAALVAWISSVDASELMMSSLAAAVALVRETQHPTR